VEVFIKNRRVMEMSVDMEWSRIVSYLDKIME
jgi:hypothetical protein